MPFEFDPNLFPDDDVPIGGPPPGARKESEEPLLEANRPAEGALRTTAEDELNQSWQGGVGASDFLGLDEELRSPRAQRAMPPSPPHEHPAAPHYAPPPASNEVQPLFDDLEIAIGADSSVTGAPDSAEFDFGSDEGPPVGPKGSWLLNRDEAPLHVAGTPSNRLTDDSDEASEHELVGAGAGSFGATFVERDARSRPTRRSILAGSALFILALAGMVLYDRGADEVRVERSASTGGARPTGPLEPPARPAHGFTPLNDPGGPPPVRSARTPLSQADVPLPSDDELLADLVDLAWSARSVETPPRLTDLSAPGASPASEVTPSRTLAFAPLLTGRRTAAPWSEAQHAPAFAPCELDPAELALAEATLPEEARRALAGGSLESTSGFGTDGDHGLAALLPSLPEVVSLTDRESSGAVALGAGQDDASALPGGSRETRTASFDPDAVTLLPGVAERLSRASESDLENLWPGTEPPLDQFARDHRLLTPRVGRVRVVLDDDELFEGRLYAIGERRLWIDTTVGRIAFPEERVASVERISGAAGRTPGSSPEVAGLERVGVHVPGGMLYGRLVKHEGDRVTIVPDIGGRMTLEGATVETIGRMRTTIVSMAEVPE